jgi:hypothetical protein
MRAVWADSNPNKGPRRSKSPDHGTVEQHGAPASSQRLLHSSLPSKKLTEVPPAKVRHRHGVQQGRTHEERRVDGGMGEARAQLRAECKRMSREEAGKLTHQSII